MNASVKNTWPFSAILRNTQSSATVTEKGSQKHFKIYHKPTVVSSVWLYANTLRTTVDNVSLL